MASFRQASAGDSGVDASRRVRARGCIARELEATTTVTERMSEAQLDAIIARGRGLDPAATDEDAQIIQ